MAKVRQELPKAKVGYDRDFFGWTQQQAELLRRAAALRPGTDLDVENLAEEIESLGKRDRRALTNYVARIAEHLLKLQYSPAKDPRPGWENSVDVHRSKARRILADSPGLGSDLQDMLGESYDEGRRRAARALSGEVDPKVLPERCPYAVDQLLDHDWWP
jgi:Domain of unknown function DUF29